MSEAGWILIGLAVGVPLGGLATYGFLFAWAIKNAQEEEHE